MDNKKLKEIFSRVLKLNVELITENLSIENTEKWDSLITMHLVLELEEEFSIRFTIEEIMAMRSFEAVKDIINKHIHIASKEVDVINDH